MMFVKFEGSPAQSIDELEEYLYAVDEEIHFSSTFERGDNFVKVMIETQRDMKEYLQRVLEDYETLGFEMDQEVALSELSVFVSDPELNSFFIHQRINIQEASNEALSEIISEAANDNAALERRLDLVETACNLNGMYNMRKILGVIVNALDEKGIFIGEKINKVSMETIH